VVFEAISGDHNTYAGATGSDFFFFTAAGLNATDTLIGGGGAGTDFLVITTAGTVTAADLANVSQIEILQLQAGGSVALANGLSNTGSLETDGTAAIDTIDGSAVAGYNIVIKGGGGGDTLKGGAGNDQVFLPDASFAAINGNGGIDRIILTSAFDNATFDLTANASKITNIEAISLESADNALLNLGPGDIPQINSGANFLYVTSDLTTIANDQVNVTGAGWTQLETNHTNAAVAPGHTFIHYHNTNGSDLYIDVNAGTNLGGTLAASNDFAAVTRT